MKPIRKFTVRAVVPGSLSALEELAGNLRWSWHEPTKRLFEHIDPELWRSSRRDPVAFLGEVDPARLDELAADGGYVEWAERERHGLREYLSEPRWFQSLGTDAPRTVAYFSPEFGITAALPQYSGGLGILAGDHLKAASDLGVPLIGVGLFYKAGYFAQSISPDGWQQERYPVLDPDGLPLSVLRRPDGSPVQVTLALPDDESLHARVWKAAVGRITLLLLDTDIPANTDDLRSVTDRLYGGGGEHRLLQELLLGIGGARAVRAFTELSGGPDARRVPHERGPRRIPRPRAHRDAHRRGPLVRRGAAARARRHGVHDPHAGARRASTASTARSSSATSPARCSPASTRPTRSRSASSPAPTPRRARSTWP